MQRHRPLRAAEADVETRLWLFLKILNGRGRHFRRRSPYRSFILDFVDHEAKLAIVLKDGEPGAHSVPAVARDYVLAAAGYTVLRWWKRDAVENFPALIDAISRALEDRPNLCANTCCHRPSKP
jgi:very-short-patch-repair endonuclease